MNKTGFEDCQILSSGPLMAEGRPALSLFLTMAARRNQLAGPVKRYSLNAFA